MTEQGGREGGAERDRAALISAILSGAVRQELSSPGACDKLSIAEIQRLLEVVNDFLTMTKKWVQLHVPERAAKARRARSEFEECQRIVELYISVIMSRVLDETILQTIDTVPPEQKKRLSEIVSFELTPGRNARYNQNQLPVIRLTAAAINVTTSTIT